MTWITTTAEQLSAGDLILWGTAREVESVAGNEKNIVVTFEGGETATFGRRSPVWRKVNRA